MRPILLLSAFGALACHPSPRTSAADTSQQPPTADSIASPPANLDLSGAWASGAGVEPTERTIELRLQCNYTPALWILDQSGDTITARTVPESRAQGVASPPPVLGPAARGRLSGVNVTLEMPGTLYVLHYDSTSGHLRGTLNGAPFWAVRQEIIHPTGCIPPPE